MSDKLQSIEKGLAASLRLAHKAKENQLKLERKLEKLFLSHDGTLEGKNRRSYPGEHRRRNVIYE